MSTRDATVPPTFLWGTSTSAYQIEGGNTNTDWWRFEHLPDSVAAEPCGDACDSWHRYEEDLDLLVRYGLNSFRLSIEWARVEPERGVISKDALEPLSRGPRGVSHTFDPARGNSAPLHAATLGR